MMAQLRIVRMMGCLLVCVELGMYKWLGRVAPCTDIYTHTGNMSAQVPQRGAPLDA